MLSYTDESLVKGLKEQNSVCIKYLYREYFPLAKSLVERNSGTYQDAEDLMQDSIVALYCKVTTGEFGLRSSLKTYFYSVLRNLWLQRLERKWRLSFEANVVKEPSLTSEIPDPDIKEEQLERKRLFQKHFLELPRRCQMMLTLFMMGLSLREIAEVMDYKNEEYAKARKYQCKKILRRKIMNDPQCKPYLDYEG